MLNRKSKRIEENIFDYEGKKYSIVLYHKGGIIHAKYFKIEVYEIIEGKKPTKILTEYIYEHLAIRINGEIYFYNEILDEVENSEDSEFNEYLECFLIDCIEQYRDSKLIKNRIKKRLQNKF